MREGLEASEEVETASDVATFSMVVPASKRESVAPVSGWQAQPSPSRRRLRLLVVEDDENDAELLLLELRRGNFDITWQRVDTAEAMKEKLDQYMWDLVVSDYSMPQFDAPRALAVLKESGLDLPFIVLSGTITEEEHAVEALRAGAHDFISKGNLARLLPAIDRELEEAQVRRARREAELALRETEQRYRRIIETTNEGVWMIDEGARTTFLNARMASHLGLESDELLGRSIFEFIHDDSRADAARMFARRGPGPAEHAEIRFGRSDGSDLWALVDATPIFDVDERYVGALVMVMDVTQRKRLEERLRQAQKLEAVGSLAGGVAHDFNNLLAIISSYAELMEQSILDEALLDDLHEIRAAAARAAGLTDQLLAFSRKQVLNPIVVDPNELVLDMQRMLGRVIGDGISLRSRLCTEVRRVSVDRLQADQVLMNLIVNARDAMPRGGTITMETANALLGESLDEMPVVPGEYVALSVSDTGTGMDKETQARLFEPFFTTKPPGKGTGLGLATVHGIVRQSGGVISVKSALGEGTTFTVYLPAGDAPS
jgi:PAS domain S-box-containing protein